MSDSPANIALPASAEPTLGERPESYSQRVMRYVLANNRARVGIAWVCFLLLLAVFAPFIANSLPLAVKIDGRWSSPLLRHLGPADVVLPIAFFTAVMLLFARRVSLGRRLLVLAAVTLAAVAVAVPLVQKPEVPVYSRYREMEREGRIQAIVRVPIPYSASDRLRDRPDQRNRPPSAVHPLGTEDNGADVLSRMIHASRIALSIGLIATGIAVVIGVTVGALMGYFVGRVDIFGMRLIEIFEAIPTLFLLIAFVAAFGRNLYIMMAIIGAVGWTGHARFIRGEFLRLRKQDFVQAAIAAGLPLRSVLFRHMLPNGITPVLVSASFGVAAAILSETTLSFLGLGLVDEPSWGQLLNQALGVGGTFIWWIAVYPGAAIFLTVLSLNLIGEALRDAIDPKFHRVR